MATTYREVKADILSQITRGVWPPGGLMPNEVDLAERYGCARATVNRAMQELADDGIIERRRKAGTRVRTAPMRQARFDIPLVRQEIEHMGAPYRYALLSRETRPVPAWLRDRLQLAGTASVLHLTCLHSAGDTPYQHEDRWISLDVLPKAREADFSETGPNEWLVAAMPYSDVEISFSATSAEPRIADKLACEPGDALFTTERTTWWNRQAITFVRLSHRPGHMMTTRY